MLFTQKKKGFVWVQNDESSLKMTLVLIASINVVHFNDFSSPFVPNPCFVLGFIDRVFGIDVMGCVFLLSSLILFRVGLRFICRFAMRYFLECHLYECTDFIPIYDKFKFMFFKGWQKTIFLGTK